MKVARKLKKIMHSKKTKNNKENLLFHQNAFELSLKPDEKSTAQLLKLSNEMYEAVPKYWRGPRPSLFNMKLIGFTSCTPALIKSDVADVFSRILHKRIDGSTYFTFSQVGYDPSSPGSISITPPKDHIDWSTLSGVKICTMLHPKLNRSHPSFNGLGDKVESDSSFVEIYNLTRKSKNLMSQDVLSRSQIHIDLFHPNVRDREFDPELYMLECHHLPKLIRPIEITFKRIELEGLCGRYPAQMYIDF
jgi:hypothetical protein